MEPEDAISVRFFERADDNPVGIHEIADRAPLGEELGVRHVADVGEPAVVEPAAHVVSCADGHRTLHHDHRATGDVLGQLVDDRPDGAQVGVAGLGRRRADRDVQEFGGVNGLGDVERERDPVAIALHHLLEPRFVDRHLTSL